MAIDVPAGRALTVYTFDSDSCVFNGENPWVYFRPQELGCDIWWTSESTLGSHSLGTLAEPGLSYIFVLNDLTVAGSWLAAAAWARSTSSTCTSCLPTMPTGTSLSTSSTSCRCCRREVPYGQPATWGDGDWNGGPGGYPGEPPGGDGLFDQQDIVAALQTGKYLSGAYVAITQQRSPWRRTDVHCLRREDGGDCGRCDGG